MTDRTTYLPVISEHVGDWLVRSGVAKEVADPEMYSPERKAERLKRAQDAETEVVRTLVHAAAIDLKEAQGGQQRTVATVIDKAVKSLHPQRKPGVF